VTQRSSERAAAIAPGGTDPDELPAVLRDELPYRIVRPYRVRFEESTATETVRSAIYLAWVADIAWQHSVLLGFGRDWYSERGLFWLVRAIRLDVLAPIRTYDSVMVSTRVTGYRRVGARRESEVRDRSGALLARLEIDWVMTNERGVPTRVPEDFHRFVVDGGIPYEMHKLPLPETPADAAELRFRVRRRDLDPLEHVNNSVYLDYFEEALAAAGRGDLLAALPRRYVLDFASAAARDDELVGRVWAHQGGWVFRLSRSEACGDLAAGASGDGCEIFRARLEPLPELGEEGSRGA
jgi:acyl-CoA thioesterase FadM